MLCFILFFNRDITGNADGFSVSLGKLDEKG